MKRKNVLIDLSDNKTLEIISEGFRLRDEKCGSRFGKGLGGGAYFWLVVLLRVGIYGITVFMGYNYFLSNPDLYLEGISDFEVLGLSGGIVPRIIAPFIYCYLLTQRLCNMGYSKEEISEKFWPLYLFSLIWPFVDGLLILPVWLVESVLLRATSKIRPMAAYFSGFWLIFSSKNEKYRRAILDGKYSDKEIEDVYLENLPPAQAPIYRSSNSSIEEIRELNELFEEGIITREEFEKKKKKILDI